MSDIRCIAFKTRQERKAFRIALSQITRCGTGRDGDVVKLIFGFIAGSDEQNVPRLDLAGRRDAKQGSFARFAFEFLGLNDRGDMTAGQVIKIRQNA